MDIQQTMMEVGRRAREASRAAARADTHQKNAAVKAIAAAIRRDAAALLAANAEDLAAVRGRPPVVVRVCPGVPGASSGTGQPAPGVGDTGVGEDIGPTLSACLTELYRYRALSRAIQAQ